MAKQSKVIVINLSEWTTQANKAKERNCSIQYINKLIKQGKLTSKRIDELGIVLVEK
jgi:polysaccharide pyruvyl transferase WcaK-like protein